MRCFFFFEKFSYSSWKITRYNRVKRLILSHTVNYKHCLSHDNAISKAVNDSPYILEVAIIICFKSLQNFFHDVNFNYVEPYKILFHWVCFQKTQNGFSLKIIKCYQSEQRILDSINLISSIRKSCSDIVEIYYFIPIML